MEPIEHSEFVKQWLINLTNLGKNKTIKDARGWNMKKHQPLILRNCCSVQAVALAKKINKNKFTGLISKIHNWVHRRVYKLGKYSRRSLGPQT